MIGEEDQVKALAAYLRPFKDVELSEDDVEYFSRIMPKLKTAYVKHPDPRYLKKFGIYCVLNFGWINYRLIDTYEITSIMLGLTESEEGEYPSQFYKFYEKLLFIRYPKSTTINIKNQEMIMHTVDYRVSRGKHTVVLTEVDLSDVKLDFPGEIITLAGSADASKRLTDNVIEDF